MYQRTQETSYKFNTAAAPYKSPTLVTQLAKWARAVHVGRHHWLLFAALGERTDARQKTANCTGNIHCKHISSNSQLSLQISASWLGKGS